MWTIGEKEMVERNLISYWFTPESYTEKNERLYKDTIIFA